MLVRGLSLPTTFPECFLIPGTIEASMLIASLGYARLVYHKRMPREIRSIRGLESILSYVQGSGILVFGKTWIGD